MGDREQHTRNIYVLHNIYTSPKISRTQTFKNSKRKKKIRTHRSRNMPKLHFYYAAMNAGKSTTLLQADFNYRERGMRTLLFTTNLDDRYGGTRFVFLFDSGDKKHTHHKQWVKSHPDWDVNQKRLRSIVRTTYYVTSRENMIKKKFPAYSWTKRNF